MGRETLLAMEREFRTDPKDVLCAVGPSICQSCYEVSEDVAAEFQREFPGHESELLQVVPAHPLHIGSMGLIGKNKILVIRSQGKRHPAEILFRTKGGWKGADAGAWAGGDGGRDVSLPVISPLKRKRILHMNDFLSQYPDYIKTAGHIFPISVMQTVINRRFADPPLFSSIHCLQGMGRKSWYSWMIWNE